MIKFFKIFWLIFAFIAINAITYVSCGKWYYYLCNSAGILFVILNAYRVPISFVFGLIYTIAYGLIAFDNRIYGDFMFNVLYGLPMCCYGLVKWYKKSKSNILTTIPVKSLTSNKRILLAIIYAVAVFLIGKVLSLFGDISPYIDSFTTVSQIIAYILLAIGLSECWLIFTLNNIVSIVLWKQAYDINSMNISIMLMYSIYLINSLIGFIYWKTNEK